jgi:hypothetical protein
MASPGRACRTRRGGLGFRACPDGFTVQHFHPLLQVRTSYSQFRKEQLADIQRLSGVGRASGSGLRATRSLFQ